jgi:hypothetical protein
VNKPSRDDLYFEELATPACSLLFTTLFANAQFDRRKWFNRKHTCKDM